MAEKRKEGEDNEKKNEKKDEEVEEKSGDAILPDAESWAKQKGDGESSTCEMNCKLVP